MAEAQSDETRRQQRKLQEARSDAITFLGLAKKPSGRVASRLRDAGFPDDLIQEVLKELKEEGYLDDLQIARRMVRQRHGRQAESRFALRQRMLQAGLIPEAVETAMEEAMTDHELARDLIGTRFTRELAELGQENMSRQDKQRLSLRIARFLAGRGFDSELIRKTLRLDD
jgi:regulatory protein